MKILLVPGNNSLSHLLKCTCIADVLLSRGHEAPIAVARDHAAVLDRFGYEYHVLPDIQENDHASFPSFKWFRNPDFTSYCILSQVDLLQKVHPDRVLGIFNFTIAIAADMTNIPLDSLVCGCMLKESNDILGFHGTESEAACQKTNVDTFFSYATHKMNQALKKVTNRQINDIRDLLKGEKTFLWDFPEFMPLPPMADTFHIGPISYRKNISLEHKVSITSIQTPPKAILSFGTCSGNRKVLERLVNVCLEVGFNVMIAAGGQKKYLSLFQGNPKVESCLFPDLNNALAGASLLITHGGQITIFEALKSRVPVLVMPFQPEQAHNGICLERMGCGKLLIPPRPFRTGPKVYIDAFDNMDDCSIRDGITGLTKSESVRTNLARACIALEACNGVQHLVTMLERPVPCPSALL